MDYLKTVKTASQNKIMINGVRVSKKKDYTQENNENILSFLKRIGKNISFRELSYISNAIKTSNVVSLTQMDKSSILKIKKSKKYKLQSSLIEDIKPNHSTDPPKKIKSIMFHTNENSLTNNNHETEGEYLQNYKRYIDDDKIFKVTFKESYVLDNKKAFGSEIKELLSKYLQMSDNIESGEDSCDVTASHSGFNALMHQNLVKQYLNSSTPYRGLLLYHGLGSGKTCTSIGVIESMKSSKNKIFILTPASLKKNYISQMKFCGSSFFLEEENWEYVEYPKDNTRKEFILQIHKLTKLPIREYLEKREGIYLQSKSKKPENDISKIDKNALNEQINEMIKRRFKFISYNGITMEMWKNKIKNNNSNKNPFDHSVVIIDEGHNFVSRIINKLNQNKNSVSVEMYKHLITAENCKVVILSGTPLINYPSELGVLFNLISGCNIVIELKCNHDTKKMMSIREFKNTLKDINLIDHISYVEDTNTLKILKNPYGFVNDKSGKIIYDTSSKINVKEFKDYIIEILKNAGYKIIILADSKDNSIKMHKKFPDTEDSFNKIFIDKKNNGLKNKEYFQNKIAGLVSYIGDKKELMPKIVVPTNDVENDEIFIEKIEMNENIMKQYSIARSIERAIDKNMKNTKKKGGKDQQTSSYKIFSRAACNFVFPANIDRFASTTGEDNINILKSAEQSLNRPIMYETKLDEIEEDHLELLTHQELLTMNDGKYDTHDTDELKINDKNKQKKHQIFAEKINFLLNELTENAYKYFESDLPKLVSNTTNMKITIDPDYGLTQANDLTLYSPKFHRLLKNILDSDNEGLHLLYSNFRTLEGIGIFKIILEYYGYSEFKIKKVTGGTFKIEIINAFYNHSNFEQSDNIDSLQNVDAFTTLKGRKFYALYTGKEGDEEKEIIRNIYNGNFEQIPVNIKKEVCEYFFDNNISDMTNLYGEVIKLLMITSSGAEGIDLKNVRYVHITEPYWHPVRVDQVIGRAKRICSHKDLPPEFQNVSVFLYLLTYNKKLLKEQESMYTQLINGDKDSDGNITTTDEKLFQIMKRKKKLMQQFLISMKEASIDCFVNYDRKDKCISFPSHSSKINQQRTLRTNIEYKNDAHEVVIKNKQMKTKTPNNERGIFEEEPEKKKKLKYKYVKIEGGDGIKQKVAADFTKNPPVAYEINGKSDIPIGILIENKGTDKNRYSFILRKK